MINLFSKQQVENDMDQQTVHIPVMAQEVMQFLNLKPGAIVVDGTLGTAGHSQMMAQAVSPGGQLIGIDRDGHSLAVAAQRLKEFSSQCHLIQDDYRNLNQILHQLGIQEVDAMLFDLGISSYQLDNPERSFSLKLEGPLDMRMDQESFISAYDLVNSLSEREISTILRNFGQERWHNRIAHYLVAQRVRNPIESTKDLTDTILKAIPHRYHYQKIHPATRTFQAIRIAVNRELEALEIVLDKSIDSLKVGGRIAVIAFHSLEDRIVKEKFRTFAKAGRLQLLTKKPLRPTDQETDNNPRSRSARLRVAQRLK